MIISLQWTWGKCILPSSAFSGRPLSSVLRWFLLAVLLESLATAHSCSRGSCTFTFTGGTFRNWYLFPSGSQLTLAFAVRWTRGNCSQIQDIEISFLKEMCSERKQLKHRRESTMVWGSSSICTPTGFPLDLSKPSSAPSRCSWHAPMTFRWWRGKAWSSSPVKNTSLRSQERKWEQATSENFLRRRDSATSLTKATLIPPFTLGTLQTTASWSVGWETQRRQLGVCPGTCHRWAQVPGTCHRSIQTLSLYQQFDQNFLNVIGTVLY